MNHIAPWDRRNNAAPRDKFQDDLNAAFRRSFDALKGDIEAICYRANVDVKPDIEAYAIFCAGVDSAFDIDWRMNRED